MVAVILKEVLKAVGYLHEEVGQYVYSISPDTVYVRFNKPAIKIGYASSIYFHFTQPHIKIHKNHLPPAQICKWGCAPEIVEDFREYTTKSEIWLVGILGIDLLLGGIRVQRRDDLLELMEKILGTKKGRKQKRDIWGFCFSELCRDFLRLCLKPSPYQRPSADDLLKHEFITCCGDVSDILQSELGVAVKKLQDALIAVGQVKKYCEMENHEEKQQKLGLQRYINETQDVLKRKVREIDKSNVSTLSQVFLHSSVLFKIYSFCIAN